MMVVVAASGTPWFALLLTVAFYVLITLELLLPTGGAAGFAALAAIVAAIIISIQHDVYWAVGILGLTIATTPPLLVSLVRIWPRTAIGRRVLNQHDDDPPVQQPVATTRRGRPMVDLVGQTGTALSDLLPAGLVRIKGQRVDAISHGVPINRGDAVTAIGTESRSVIVRPATDTELAQSRSRPDQPAPATPEPATTETIDTAPPISPAALEFDLGDID